MTGKYTVGIVGASGAVGQELLKVLEKRCAVEKTAFGTEIDKVCLYGSARSAGKIVESSVFGSMTIQVFEAQIVKTTCDVVFLAVSGSFALEHAKTLCDGENAPVVIDNSVGRQL